MAQVIRDEDIEVDVGQASGGQTFIRVVHLPTGVSQLKIGRGVKVSQVVANLTAAVECELVNLGWSRAVG